MTIKENKELVGEIPLHLKKPPIIKSSIRKNLATKEPMDKDKTPKKIREYKNKFVKVYVSDEERMLLKQKARNAKLTLSSYMKRIGLGYSVDSEDNGNHNGNHNGTEMVTKLLNSLIGSLMGANQNLEVSSEKKLNSINLWNTSTKNKGRVPTASSPRGVSSKLKSQLMKEIREIGSKVLLGKKGGRTKRHKLTFKEYLSDKDLEKRAFFCGQKQRELYEFLEHVNHFSYRNSEEMREKIRKKEFYANRDDEFIFFNGINTFCEKMRNGIEKHLLFLEKKKQREELALKNKKRAKALK